MALQGRVAVITGSTSGIGLAIAKKLAQEGCQIVLHGSRPVAEAQTTLAEMSQYGVDVIYVQASLTEPDQGANTLISKSLEHFSTIDILVNNAGIQHVSPIESFPTEMWDKLLAVNLTANFHTTRLVLPHMRKQSWGRIITISSVHGKVGSVNKCAYVATKHGISGFSKVVALEYAGTGVTCNVICPGFVLTELIQKQIDEIAQRQNIPLEQATEELVASKHPSKKFSKPEDIAAMCAFLCGEAGDNITGAEITMDGGWTVQ